MNGKQHIIYLFLINAERKNAGRTEIMPYMPIPMYIFISSMADKPSFENEKHMAILYSINPDITAVPPLKTAEMNLETQYLYLPLLMMTNLIFPPSLSAQKPVTNGSDERTGIKIVIYGLPDVRSSWELVNEGNTDLLLFAMTSKTEYSLPVRLSV